MIFKTKFNICNLDRLGNSKKSSNNFKFSFEIWSQKQAVICFIVSNVLQLRGFSETGFRGVRYFEEGSNTKMFW